MKNRPFLFLMLCLLFSSKPMQAQFEKFHNGAHHLWAFDVGASSGVYNTFLVFSGSAPTPPVYRSTYMSQFAGISYYYRWRGKIHWLSLKFHSGRVASHEILQQRISERLSNDSYGGTASIGYEAKLFSAEVLAHFGKLSGIGDLEYTIKPTGFEVEPGLRMTAWLARNHWGFLDVNATGAGYVGPRFRFGMLFKPDRRVIKEWRIGIAPYGLYLEGEFNLWGSDMNIRPSISAGIRSFHLGCVIKYYLDFKDNDWLDFTKKHRESWPRKRTSD
ncbi:MAG: hypothetical protein AAF990_14730 [Bacteroidota bacterium]